jgi:hypothetical protein
LYYIGGKSNSYFFGVNPFLRYSYKSGKSFVYSAEIAFYDLGTYFDLGPSTLNNPPFMDPILTLRERLYDVGLHIGYEVEKGESRLSFIPSFGVNLLLPNYFRANGTPAYQLGNKRIDNIEGGALNYIHYEIQRNGISDFSVGYTLGLSLEYKINNKFSLTSAFEIKGSVTTLVRYELNYGFTNTLDDSEMWNWTGTGALTNDNARYGIRLGLKYTFI